MIMYDYFMLLALLVSMDSKDPNTKVGACIVSNDNRIISSSLRKVNKKAHILSELYLN